jgi:SSS family solute:Na+ symporter
MSSIDSALNSLSAVAFSFQVERIAPTVLEAINKVGSMANGPLLMLFTLAVFRPALGQGAAIAGFVGGLLCNMFIWALLPQVSWLWWNVSGFVSGWVVAVSIGLVTARTDAETFRSPPALPYRALVAMFLLILATSLALQLH